MGVEHGVVHNQDVFATVGGSLRLVASALHAEPVVTGIDSAVDDEGYVTVGEVDGIAVLGIPRAAYGDAVDDDVLGIAGMQVELGRVLDGDTFYEDVLTTLEAYQIDTHLLLILGSSGNVGVASLVVPRIEQHVLAFAFLNTANDVLVFAPLYVADLCALDGTPVVTVTVDDSFAGDGNILALGSTDARQTLAVGTLRVNKLRLVGRHEEDGILLQMQFDVVLQLNGTCEPHTLRNGHTTTGTGHLLQLLDSLLESLGVQRHTVSYASYFGDDDLIGRNDGGGYLCHLRRQVLIIL